MPFVKKLKIIKKKKHHIVFSNNQRNPGAIACRRRRQSPAQPSLCSPFLSPVAENQSRRRQRRRRNLEDAEISQRTGPRRRREPAREFAGEKTKAQPIPLSLSPVAAENQSQDAGAPLSLPFSLTQTRKEKKFLVTEKLDQIVEI
jgi:hypothetical protein